MPVWEIVNPSDHYTIEAADFRIAAAAVLVLGRGAFGLTSDEGGAELPVFLLGGADEYLEETWPEGFGEYLQKNQVAIADCLDSVVIGNRRAYLAATEMMSPKQRAKFRLVWQDEHRSSTNDIGRGAWEIAAHIMESTRL